MPARRNDAEIVAFEPAIPASEADFPTRDIGNIVDTLIELDSKGNFFRACPPSTKMSLKIVVTQ